MQRLFVYGSLKPGEPRYKAFEEYAKYRGVELKPKPAVMAGSLYALPLGFPGVIRNEEESNITKGFVIELEGDPALIHALNLIEGYCPTNNRNSYTPLRSKAIVDKCEIPCWCYFLEPTLLDAMFARAKENPDTFEEPQLLESGWWEHNHKYFAMTNREIEDGKWRKPAGDKETHGEV